MASAVETREEPIRDMIENGMKRTEPWMLDIPRDIHSSPELGSDTTRRAPNAAVIGRSAPLLTQFLNIHSCHRASCVEPNGVATSAPMVSLATRNYVHARGACAKRDAICSYAHRQPSRFRRINLCRWF